jgi:hypothetical protein
MHFVEASSIALDDDDKLARAHVVSTGANGSASLPGDRTIGNSPNHVGHSPRSDNRFYPLRPAS